MSDSSHKSQGFRKAVDKLFKVIEIVIAIFLGVMIFFTFLNVILRQFNLGFAWSEEVARICFIYLVYLGSIIAARENRHLMIDTMIHKVPPMSQKVLYVVIQGTIIWLMGVLATGAFQNAWKNRNGFYGAFCRRPAGRFGYHYFTGKPVPYVLPERIRIGAVRGSW